MRKVDLVPSHLKFVLVNFVYVACACSTRLSRSLPSVCPLAVIAPLKLALYLPSCAYMYYSVINVSSPEGPFCDRYLQFTTFMYLTGETEIGLGTRLILIFVRSNLPRDDWEHKYTIKTIPIDPDEEVDLRLPKYEVPENINKKCMQYKRHQDLTMVSACGILESLTKVEG